MAIFPRSSTWGDPGEEPGTAAHRLHPGYGCLPDIATHCPRPRGGGGGGAPKARAGWGCRQKRMGSPRRNAGNEKQGAWSVRDRGGEQVPPPRQPLPQTRYPHGPVHGCPPAPPRGRLSTRYREHCPRPPGGGGGGAPKARAGWRLPAEVYGYLLAKARVVWGCRWSVWVSRWMEMPAKSMATVSQRCRLSPAGFARDRIGPGCVRAGGGPPEENM